MRRLTRRQRKAALALAALAVVLFTLDLGGGGLRSAHSGVRGALGSLYRGTDATVGPVRRFVAGLPQTGSREAEVQRLQHQVAQLQGQLAQRSADQATSAAVHRLQLAADQGGYRIAPARVIAVGSGQGFDWTATLDAGRTSGVLPGQTVTDGAGLVGRVVAADDATSVVLLAADPRAGIGVRDERTGQLGVATGQGTSGLHLVPLDPAADVRVGDRLSTGPAGVSSFVAGFAVGTVTSVRSSADGTTTAQVRPAVSPTSLDLVGVVLVGGTQAPAHPALTPSASAQAQR